VFMHNKRLMYTVRVGAPPDMAARTLSDPASHPTTGAELSQATAGERV
jgi:hypothetical protein